VSAFVVLGLLAFFPATSALAQPGGTIDNSGKIPFDQAFFAFEVEGPVSTMKEVPIWDELEQMLDNPYQFVLDPTVPGNFQGFPSYRTIPQIRRRSFIFRNLNGTGPDPCAPLSAGCAEVRLPGHLIHPLNYNFQGGEELRLLNIDFVEAPWTTTVPNQFHYDDPTGADGFTVTTLPSGQLRYDFNSSPIVVSPGADRIDPDEAVIDYNSPMRPDTPICVTTVEPIPPPEGSRLCGGDPGEPGYRGFGVLGGTGVGLNSRIHQYSVPAVPGGTADPLDVPNGVKSSIVGLRLYDPARGGTGFINPRNAAGGGRALRKPSLRVPPVGNNSNPGYVVNSEANLASDPAALQPSNENDYYRGRTRTQKVAAREAAAALGKALFWDMQVGSDSVQACGSCHPHAGVDNRTKGQLNSNTTGGDTTSFEAVGADGVTTMVANGEVGTASFPLHKLFDPSIPTDPLVNPGNIKRTTNDVLSSMGVSRFTEFVDIPVIGTFLPATSGVRSLPPDIGNSVTDPVTINNGFRRVEPRHTPTFFAASLNFDNFWDGRARHDFNGGSVFGAADPQSHVMVDDGSGNLAATRQIIRFASLASLATGPALSENEMSFAGRNWSKLGKRLLQGTLTGAPNTANRVVPLANQLVSTTDSVIGIYSNQGGAACANSGNPLFVTSSEKSVNGPLAAGKPGLCISYPALIKRAFYDELWQNTSMHLNGCYTDGRPDLHANQCAPGVVAIPVLNSTGMVVDSAADPFDNYVLSIGNNPATPANRDQFTQMEANMSLFFGLSVHAWVTILMPDDTPFDRFMDRNPDAFVSFGESNEAALVLDLDTCVHTGGVEPCLSEDGNFKRDPGVVAKLNCPGPEGPVNCTLTPAGGTRAPGSVDPLQGLDFFLGSNLSLKNPNFNSLRCGECHAGGTFTDHTVEISHQESFNDWAQEFSPGMPGMEIFPEPLGRGRIIAGFALEGELNGNAQDAIERNNSDFCTIAPCLDLDGGPIPGGVAGGFPQGSALFDNGVYNIGVTPIGDDTSRGGKDAFGWPLSLSRLAFKNLCGLDYSPGGDESSTDFAQPSGVGIPCPLFDPTIDFTGGGLYEETAQDQQINPGFEEELAAGVAQLPPYLAPWANNLNVGDEVQIDEVFVGVNTRSREPILEGFVDSNGPFNPAAVLGENMNNAIGEQMSTWPNVNRVNAEGSFKAAPLRNVELTNPYFHDGGNLTLRQQLDFYTRGGNFPVTNKAHRDFLVMNLLNEDEALGGYAVPNPTSCDLNAPLGAGTRAGCLVVSPGTPGAVPQFSDEEKEAIIVSVVDYLLELTDERVAFERAPFDHPEIFVPIDGRASENVAGRGTTAGTGGYTLIGQTGAACTTPLAGRSLVAGVPTVLLSDVAPLTAGPTCFKQFPAVGASGIATKLPNFLGITSGPRLVGAAADCSTVNNHYCH
jgi:cytochrome c peroxidase